MGVGSTASTGRGVRKAEFQSQLSLQLLWDPGQDSSPHQAFVSSTAQHSEDWGRPPVPPVALQENAEKHTDSR